MSDDVKPSEGCSTPRLVRALPHTRRRWRALVAALCAVAALPPLAAAPAGAQSRERLREIEETKERAQETLQGP